MENKINERILNSLNNIECTLAKRPRLSIITVVLNDKTNLEKTILSVLALKSDNIEYIIIDGGSTDGSISIIKKYEVKLDYWISEKDKGIYDAMNKGALLAKGKYLMFLNAGDYLTNDFKNSIKDGIINNLLHLKVQAYDVIYGDVLLNDSLNFKYKKAGIIKLLNHKIPFCHQSTLVLKSEFLKNQFDINYKIGADFKLFRQLYLDRKVFKYVSIPFVKYNLQGVSSNNPLQLLREYKNIIRESKHSIYKFLAIFLTNLKILKHVIFTR